MRMHFATIPLHGDTEAEATLNQFLSAHRVLSVDRHLVPAGSASVWAVRVSYDEGERRSSPSNAKKAGRIDYREQLSPEEFTVFAELRNLRKVLAERDGVPVYTVFTNDQLAAMVQRRMQTTEDLRGLPGVGTARLEKYGAAILKLLQDLAPSQATTDVPGSGTLRAP